MAILSKEAGCADGGGYGDLLAAGAHGLSAQLLFSSCPLIWGSGALGQDWTTASLQVCAHSGAGVSQLLTCRSGREPRTSFLSPLPPQ